MAKSEGLVEPAPEFPVWPFGLTAVYMHAIKGFVHWLETVTEATDAAQTLNAEADYGLALWRDFAEAYYDYALSPLTALTRAATALDRDGPDAMTAAQLQCPQRGENA